MNTHRYTSQTACHHTKESCFWSHRMNHRRFFLAKHSNLNVIFSFCREINGEKKNFCLVTNPRKKLKYRMFAKAES